MVEALRQNCKAVVVRHSRNRSFLYDGKKTNLVALDRRWSPFYNRFWDKTTGDILRPSVLICARITHFVQPLKWNLLVETANEKDWWNFAIFFHFRGGTFWHFSPARLPHISFQVSGEISWENAKNHNLPCNACRYRVVSLWNIFIYSGGPANI